MNLEDFNKLQLKFLFLFIITTPIFYFFINKILHQMTIWIQNANSINGHLVSFSDGQVIPALFLSIVFSGMVLDQFSRVLIKEKYFAYLAFADLHHKMNSARVFKYFFYTVTIISLIFSIRMAYFFAYATEQKVSFVLFFKTERLEYGLDEIVKITFSENRRSPLGNLIAMRSFRIYFKDGFIWEPPYDNLDHFVNFILDRKNICIEKIDVHE